MAVTKLWKVSVRLGQVLDYTTNPEKTANPEYSAEDYQALKDVLAYAKDEEKTEHEFFCDGINCNVAMARDQFITVKEQFGKTDGIQAYHGYLSFKENEVTPEQAQQIGMEFARKMWGKRFQVVVTTHLNTKHLHCHFVINSVSFADGKRLKDKEKSWYYFRHIADEICLEHKLSIVEKGYSISGVAQEVDHYCEGKNVIGYDELGGLKIAYVLGEKTALPQGSNLQVTAMNLQKLFVKMTEKGGGENE